MYQPKLNLPLQRLSLKTDWPASFLTNRYGTTYYRFRTGIRTVFRSVSFA